MGSSLRLIPPVQSSSNGCEEGSHVTIFSCLLEDISIEDRFILKTVKLNSLKE